MSVIIPQKGYEYIKPTNPTFDVNPPVKYVNWLNMATGEVFVCIDSTPNTNVWIGQKGTRVTKDLLVLDGNGSYVDCGAFNISYDPFTIEFWVQSLAVDGRFICQDSHSLKSGDYGMWGIQPSEGVTVFFYREPSTKILKGVTSINDGALHHIAAIRDPISGLRTLVVDGNIDAQLVGDTSRYSVSSNITIGGELSSSYESHSTALSIRDIRIWSVARSLEDIQRDKDKFLMGWEPGLLALYNTIVPESTVLKDSAGLQHGVIYY